MSAASARSARRHDGATARSATPGDGPARRDGAARPRGDEQADLSVHGGANARVRYPSSTTVLADGARAGGVAAWDARSRRRAGREPDARGRARARVLVGDVLRFPTASSRSASRVSVLQVQRRDGLRQAAKLMAAERLVRLLPRGAPPGTLAAGETFELSPAARRGRCTELWVLRAQPAAVSRRHGSGGGAPAESGPPAAHRRQRVTWNAVTTGTPSSSTLA
jgi:hypothetical protein